FDQFELQMFISKKQEMEFEDFEEVKNEKLPLLDWKSQEQGVDSPKYVSLDTAISDKILKKPAYAYCLYIGYYLTKILGIPKEVIRFRQHSINERAHYADDAWDLEIKTTQFGWVEICGIHDRTDYDLKRHAEYSKQNFEVSMDLDPYKKEIPQVLEIAFGIDRIIYTLLETTFNVEEGRIVLKLNPILAPNTVAVFPLVKNKEEIKNLAQKVHRKLLENRIGSFFDAAGSIGKRYRRQDELGTKWCITVDYESLDDHTVTIRERDSMEQIRVKISELPETIQSKQKE
ncbi:MAG: His/Gly/Thr/Pro-type tRNA ligase C-terminal domain-containing protein, partial [Promethearchaeota archaeon]